MVKKEEGVYNVYVLEVNFCVSCMVFFVVKVIGFFVVNIVVKVMVGWMFGEFGVIMELIFFYVFIKESVFFF